MKTKHSISIRDYDFARSIIGGFTLQTKYVADEQELDSSALEILK